MTLTGLVQRSLSRPPCSHDFVWAFAAIGTAALARLALNPWVAGVPFLTFFPTVLLAGLFLGWRWGSVVLAGSALAANFAFQPPYWAFALSAKQVVSTLGFLVAGALMLLTTDAVRTLLLQVEAARHRETELNLELSHRVQNNLTIIQSLARQTANATPDPQQFYDAFTDRLIALSAAHRILVSRDFETAGLPELAAAALTPFGNLERITATGPAGTIPPASAVPLVMALHELATNATKYGALSNDLGRVAVSWSMRDGTCVLHWRESGGPPVTPPSTRGLGSRVLRRQTGLDAVALSFRPDGVCCEIVIAGARPL